MRLIPHFGRRAPAPAHRGSLARRLLLVLAAMLLALVAVAGARVVTFGATINALEEFRAETVGESERIAEVRSLLEEADDAGEAYVETDNVAEGEKFASISDEIARGFDDLEGSGSRQERLLAASAHHVWELAYATVESAVGLPSGGDGARLDPFHDGVDEAAGLLSDQFALNVAEVGDEICSASDPRAHPALRIPRGPPPRMCPGRLVVAPRVSVRHLPTASVGGGGRTPRP